MQKAVVFNYSEIKACGKEKVKSKGRVESRSIILKKFQKVSKYLVIQPPQTEITFGQFLVQQFLFLK